MRSLTIFTILFTAAAAYAQLPPAAVQPSRLRDRTALERLIKDYETRLPAQANDPQVLRVLGIAYHNLAAQEVSGALDKAVEYLEQARALAPGDAEVLAFFGSVRTLVAKDSWNPVKKLVAVQDGMKLLDEAVSRQPDNVTVRLVRAGNSLRLPKMFDRLPYAKTDYEHVLKLARPEADPPVLPRELLAEVHLKLGDLYKGEDDVNTARGHWVKAAELAPDSEWGREARTRR